MWTHGKFCGHIDRSYRDLILAVTFGFYSIGFQDAVAKLLWLNRWAFCVSFWMVLESGILWG